MMLKSARRGDTILVWRLDRLGRNAIDLHTLTKDMNERGIGFRSLTEGFETITAMGKLMFGVFAAFAEFERNLTIERTKAGMAAARSRGRIPGAKPKFTAEQKIEIKRRLATGEIGVRGLAKELGVSATTITNARK
jgi:DNA invertase Pin-like site-specific DNA recombinase